MHMHPCSKDRPDLGHCALKTLEVAPLGTLPLSDFVRLAEVFPTDCCINHPRDASAHALQQKASNA